MRSPFPLQARSSIALVTLSLASLVACAEPNVIQDDAGAPDSGHNVPDSGIHDSGNPDSGVPEAGVPFEACDTPILKITPAADAKGRAITELAKVSNTATLTWDEQYGTLSTSDLVVPVEDCNNTQKLGEFFMNFASAHADLFQIDPSEWRVDDNFKATCQQFKDSGEGFRTLRIGRQKFGPYEMIEDFISVVFRVQGENVVMTNFYGIYIPKYSETLTAGWKDCQLYPNALAAEKLTETVFDYRVYEPQPAPLCTLGDEKFFYTALPTDELKFSETPLVRPTGTGTGYSLQLESRMTVVVAKDHYTPDLIASDANCSLLDEAGIATHNVGWIRTYDAFSGKIIQDRSTPLEYCTVCLSGSSK